MKDEDLRRLSAELDTDPRFAKTLMAAQIRSNLATNEFGRQLAKALRLHEIVTWLSRRLEPRR